MLFSLDVDETWSEDTKHVKEAVRDFFEDKFMLWLKENLNLSPIVIILTQARVKPPQGMLSWWFLVCSYLMVEYWALVFFCFVCCQLQVGLMFALFVYDVT